MAAIPRRPNRTGFETYRIGIVAHASRVTDAKDLGKIVRADFISIDKTMMGCEENHFSVLHHLQALPSSYSVVLEDDAVPIAGFRRQLRQALIHTPTPLVSLYLGRQRPPWAQAAAQTATAECEAQQADWILSRHLLHAVGYAIKTDLIASLLRFPPTPLPIDQHISRWAQTYGHLTAYTYPSLVDHADNGTIAHHPDNQPRPPGRIAWKTAAHPNWTTQTVTMKV